jgi:sugar phosphate isomerase/epimerase
VVHNTASEPGPWTQSAFGRGRNFPYNLTMQFGISTQIYRGKQVNVDLLESIRRAGYEHFELFCNRPHIDFHDRSLIRSIGAWFRENALPAPSLHLPFIENVGPTQRLWINVLEPERRHREAALDQVKRALEFVDHAPISYAVLHLGNPRQEFSPVAFEHAYAAIAQIRMFAGVEVAIENIPNEISTLERIEEFKSASQIPDLGICYDTGHGHLQNASPSLKSVRTMHLHDNSGEKDEHLWPFEGTMNWYEFIEKLVVENYSGPLMFEARGEEVSKGDEVKSRLQDLWDEAQNSIEEYRLKYFGTRTSPNEEREETE